MASSPAAGRTRGFVHLFLLHSAARRRPGSQPEPLAVETVLARGRDAPEGAELHSRAAGGAPVTRLVGVARTACADLAHTNMIRSHCCKRTYCLTAGSLYMSVIDRLIPEGAASSDGISTRLMARCMEDLHGSFLF